MLGLLFLAWRPYTSLLGCAVNVAEGSQDRGLGGTLYARHKREGAGKLPKGDLSCRRWEQSTGVKTRLTSSTNRNFFKLVLLNLFIKAHKDSYLVSYPTVNSKVKKKWSA